MTKKPKTIEYVCNALINTKLISKSIKSSSSEEAIKLFQIEFGAKPENIHGPFYRKRDNIIDNTKEIEFSGTRIKGIYRDWYVIASILNYPKDSVFLLFDKRIDGKKMVKPTGTFIIKLEEIKEIK